MECAIACLQHEALYGPVVQAPDARERARRAINRWWETARSLEPSLTQAEFARRIGYTQAWFAKVLSRGPRLEDTDAIAAAMGTTAASLVDDKGMTSPVTGSPNDRQPDREGDTLSSDPFGRLRWSWEKLPEDQQEAALDAMQEALKTFKQDVGDGPSDVQAK
jgi:hypothetical protein